MTTIEAIEYILLNKHAPNIRLGEASGKHD